MNSSTQLYCLIGDPVAHSLSPVMHNALFSAWGIDAVYTTMLVKKDDLAESIRTLKTLNAKGVNVTMPHKRTVVEFLDEIDQEADKIGAVNTILNKDGRLIGRNTDSIGAVNAIKERVSSLKGKSAIILGKGGAAKSLDFGLKKEGVKTLMLGREEMDENNLGRLIPDSDLVCNCTPIGMNGESSPVPERFLRRGLVVFDSVYGPDETFLIRAAKKHNCIAIDGEEMLVNQGSVSFEFWTGIKPDKQVMFRAIRRLKNKKSRKGRNVYLIGFMGAGKTTIGSKLAARLKSRYVDTDIEISNKYGNSIRTIFEREGEDRFREMERQEIDAASRKRGVVVSCGGGAVLDFTNVSKMRESGTVVLLKAEPRSIVKRLGGNMTRPLLLDSTKESELGVIKELLDSRSPYYTLARDLEFRTDGKSVDELVKEVEQSMGEHY
jgi:shikimate dehydrogenase